MAELIAWPFGQATASEYLRELLLRADLPYRQRWYLQAKRPGKANEINALAVARYLAEVKGVWGAGTTALQAKDTVSRALAAKPENVLLTPETLTKFIDGFSMHREHDEQLRMLLSGAEPELVRPVVGHVLSRGLDSDEPPGHLTVSLHEFHYIGANGLPERHKTIQVIRALAEGLERYPYRFDTEHGTVSIARGGHRVAPQTTHEEQLYGVDLVLQRPLHKDATASLEYDTVFSYMLDDPPEREFRRGTRSRTENLEMYLKFHRSRLPRKVWWAEWDDYLDGAQIIDQERVYLDADLAVHLYLPYIEKAVVGFCWEWGD